MKEHSPLKSMNRCRLIILIWLVILLILPCINVLLAKDETSVIDEEDRIEMPDFTYHTVKSKSGLSWRVPIDMPIEERNGLLGPIPFDEYVYGKFAQIWTHVANLETRIIQLQKEVETLKAAAEPPSAPIEADDPSPVKSVLA